MLDPQLRERPADLGEGARSDLPARLGRMEIMAAAVGVERAEQPLGRDRLDQGAKARDRSFLRDQKRRINLARRIVERDDQIERPAAVKPGVPRSVLMQHHTRHRPARPLASVRPAPRRLGQKPASLKIGPGPGVAPAEAVTPDKMLMEMLGREAGVAFAVKSLDLPGLIVGNRPAGAPPQTPIQKPLLAFVLKPPAPPPKRPLAHPHKLRRLKLAQTSSLPAAHHIAKLQHPQSLPLLRPAHRPLQKGNHAPDRSPATWTGHSICSLHLAMRNGLFLRLAL
jgi:hypothetical protein